MLNLPVYNCFHFLHIFLFLCYSSIEVPLKHFSHFSFFLFISFHFHFESFLGSFITLLLVSLDFKSWSEVYYLPEFIKSPRQLKHPPLQLFWTPACYGHFSIRTNCFHFINQFYSFLQNLIQNSQYQWFPPPHLLKKKMKLLAGSETYWIFHSLPN